MTLQEVLIIKEQKSQMTKDMTTEQLNEFFAGSLREFSRITGKRITKEEFAFTRGAEYYANLSTVKADENTGYSMAVNEPQNDYGSNG